jgi:fatty acid CoA ligase FadD36
VAVDLVPSLSAAMSARRRPEPAVTVAGRSLELEDLAGAAAAVAAEIEGMPALAVHADASLETVVAVLGGLMAAVPVVPVPYDAGPIERDHILSDSGALAGPPVDVSRRGQFRGPAADPDRPAMILYTSGTTGSPKGVQLSARAIAADLDLLAAAWSWTAEDLLVHGLPLFHVHGLILGILGPLRVGSPVVHTGRPTPAAYAEAHGSLYFGVPTVWARVAADASAAAALRSARLLVSGSAGLPVPVFDQLLQQAGQGPIERYGMTETLITVSGRPELPRRPGWVGHPLPGVGSRLVGEEGEPVPSDGESVGSLEVLTPTVMSGYLNHPEATAEVTTADGWIRTGDVACIDPSGWHRIVGRQSTDLIKTGGYRVGAGEVEAALLGHPAVTEAAVVGVPDDDLGQAIVAYVVAAGVGAADLVEFVAGRLSAHKRPRQVLFVSELPRNAMGKVQKGLLLENGR